MTKPKQFGVTFLPSEIQIELEGEFGEYWMDHDPEQHFCTASFDTFEQAHSFCKEEDGPFTQMFERTKIVQDENGLWDFQEEPIVLD